MINLNPFIYKKLKELGVKVIKNYPKAKSDFPCIVYKEIINTPAFKVNGVEVISDISYQFDIYSVNDTEIKMLADNLDLMISSLGFNRRFNESMDTESYFRRTLRYAGKIDIRNNLVFE